MNETAEIPEFAFVSDMPRKKTREGLISQVKRFFRETEGGAVPVAMAAKFLGVSSTRVYELVREGKLSAFKVGSTVLVSVQDIESRMAEKPKRGRPKKP